MQQKEYNQVNSIKTTTPWYVCKSNDMSGIKLKASRQAFILDEKNKINKK